jgi:hypothetical protein
MANSSFNTNMRVYHRYLGFFLAGIMAMYAISGIVLIFRDTQFLKSEKRKEKTIAPATAIADLGKALNIKEFKVDKEVGDTVYFKQGTYNKTTGAAVITTKELPTILDKFTKIHKAKSKDPLFFLNIFFGVSLLFFVLSSFWMFMPKSAIFKKGMYFTIAGIVLTIVLLLL